MAWPSSGVVVAEEPNFYAGIGIPDDTTPYDQDDLDAATAAGYSDGFAAGQASGGGGGSGSRPPVVSQLFPR